MVNYVGTIGDDLLRGGIGNDFIDGGDGDDTIVDYRGSNVLIGGNGDDVFGLPSRGGWLLGSRERQGGLGWQY